MSYTIESVFAREGKIYARVRSNDNRVIGSVDRKIVGRKKRKIDVGLLQDCVNHTGHSDVNRDDFYISVRYPVDLYPRAEMWTKTYRFAFDGKMGYYLVESVSSRG